jgi:hypothetical protein
MFEVDGGSTKCVSVIQRRPRLLLKSHKISNRDPTKASIVTWGNNLLECSVMQNCLVKVITLKFY